MTDLASMTWDRWIALPRHKREQMADLSDLSPQLRGYEGYHVEVLDEAGDTPRRFNVGRSTGWRPCHLEVHNARSRGGGCARKSYFAVRPVRFVG